MKTEWRQENKFVGKQQGILVVEWEGPTSDKRKEISVQEMATKWKRN